MSPPAPVLSFQMAEHLMTLAYDNGINLFDTAEVYAAGKYVPFSRTEEGGTGHLQRATSPVPVSPSQALMTVSTTLSSF